MFHSVRLLSWYLENKILTPKDWLSNQSLKLLLNKTSWKIVKLSMMHRDLQRSTKISMIWLRKVLQTSDQRIQKKVIRIMFGFIQLSIVHGYYGRRVKKNPIGRNEKGFFVRFDVAKSILPMTANWSQCKSTQKFNLRPVLQQLGSYMILLSGWNQSTFAATWGPRTKQQWLVSQNLSKWTLRQTFSTRTRKKFDVFPATNKVAATHFILTPVRNSYKAFHGRLQPDVSIWQADITQSRLCLGFVQGAMVWKTVQKSEPTGMAPKRFHASVFGRTTNVWPGFL